MSTNMWHIVWELEIAQFSVDLYSQERHGPRTAASWDSSAHLGEFQCADDRCRQAQRLARVAVRAERVDASARRRQVL